MRVLFLGNNWVGWQIAVWLRAQGEEIVGMVLHPPERHAYGMEILRDIPLDPGQVFDGSRLRDPEVQSAIRALKPHIGISAYFGYIVRREFLTLLPRGCINVHPAYLPHNRGAHPNVWSIVDRTPAGVTIHYMDEGVDTGDIIARREVPVEPVDTGESLYRALERAAVALFQETWPLIRDGRAPRIRQEPGGRAFHRVRDVERIDEIDLERQYAARELIDIIRARTFPPHRGSYFRVGGRKVYLCLQLLYEEHLEKGDGHGAASHD